MSDMEPFHSWLKLICQMIPGIKQAVFVISSYDKDLSCDSIQWPEDGLIDKRIVEEANESIKHMKLVDKLSTSEVREDSSAETIIAYYFSNIDNFSGSLSILLDVKPSQRAIVIKMLQWGEKWLQLLIQQHKTKTHAIDRSDVNKSLRDRFSNFNLKSYKSLFFVFVLMILLSLLNGTYNVTAPASLEGRIQRVIVAPFDSFIHNAYTRAGENVSTGEVVAELDKRDLLIEQQRYLAQKNEFSRQYRQALAQRDMAQVAIFKSQMRQVEAKLNLTQKKIQRSSLAAPIDGVIISGDLSRSLGAPVKAGDVLFEIAPLDEYRLVMLVDEKQISDVKINMRGVLNLKALPAIDLEFIVKKVSPVFEDKAGGIAYRVEALFDQPHDALRPGMQGVAKIAVAERSYAWIYFHELYYAIRFWLWSWWI